MSEKKGAKGGKGKKKNKKEEKNKLTQVDRTFYELTITDLNQKLARLRAHLSGLDDSNIVLKEKLREIEEDHTDVAAHLERTLADRDQTIREQEERLTELIKIREAESIAATERIKELETKYKSMHDQLTSEIKLLNGKLNSLDEFRVQRDLLLAKFDDQEDELKEKERTQQELIYNMEQKAVVEKDALKKEVEAKLLQVSEDFTRSSEIRNAGYTRRLIRENIALQKEIDVLVLSQIKMQQQFVDQQARHKVMNEQYEALDQMKKQLIKNAQNKIMIIEKLTDNYEKLKTKYVEVAKYRKLYETVMKRDICERFTYKDMSKKMRGLAQRIEVLKMDKNRLISVHQQHETEIQRLRNIIIQIKTTVQAAIDAIYLPVEETESEDELNMRKLRRRDLLTELMDIVSSHQDKLPKTPSVQTISRSASGVYERGKMGLLPRTASSLFEIFKRDAHKTGASEQEAFEIKQQDSKIIPKGREGNPIFDVELGSTLYVSSSHENLEMIAVEDEQLDGEEQESSSAYASSSTEAAPDASPSAAPTSDIAPGTTGSAPQSRPGIETPVTATEGTSLSSPHMYDVQYEEGDEEMSINLFY